MMELLCKGVEVYLRKEEASHRKTDFDLVLVNHNGTLVSIDSRVPNKLLHEAITECKLSEFEGFHVSRSEPMFHDSRFDLLLKNHETQIMLEAKSCTLVEEKVALFPDAPTKRGSRHMLTLIEALAYGRTAVVFVIQRNDVEEFRPYHQNDPVFSHSLIQAAENGVEIYAYRCRVNLNEIIIVDRLPVNLGPE
jgi:sugar fermentation stimulation protein A